jgi:hypothetical protein
VNALSKKLKDTTIQNQVITVYHTQVLLPQNNITDKIVQDLELAPVKSAISSKLSTTPYQEETKYLSTEYTSIKLINMLLSINQTPSELKEFWAKAKNEKEDT